MAQLIDTSVFIEMERRGLSVDVIDDITDPGESGAMAAMTASELLVGVHGANTTERRLRRESWVEAVFEAIPVLSFDLRTSRVHAVLWHEIHQRGVPIGDHDMEIAATALVNGYGILTHNLRHFRGVPGLDVQKPDWTRV